VLRPFWSVGRSTFGWRGLAEFLQQRAGSAEMSSVGHARTDEDFVNMTALHLRQERGRVAGCFFALSRRQQRQWPSADDAAGHIRSGDGRSVEEQN
jgi:hypothetical protein